jgi:hypothetical protein
VRLHLLTVPIAAGALLGAPAAAPAKQFLFGSDLPAPADAAETHGAGTIHWNRAVARHRPGPPGEPAHPASGVRTKLSAVAPADGQLRYVTIWGGVPPGGSAVRFRFVVLRPQGGASVELAQVERSQIHTLPVTPDPAHRVPSKSFNWELCLRKGDHLGLLQLDPGSLRIFASVPGSMTGWYENAAGVFSGDVFSGTATPDRELLMQVLETSGPDAFSRCPGGYKEHVFHGIDVSDSTRLGARDSVRFVARCPRGTYGGCFGRLRLRTRVSGRMRTLGGVGVALGHGRQEVVEVDLSAPDAASIRRKGTIHALAVMRGHDDPSDPRNRRAPGTRPGRQSGTFTQPLLISPTG